MSIDILQTPVGESSGLNSRPMERHKTLAASRVDVTHTKGNIFTKCAKSQLTVAIFPDFWLHLRDKGTRHAVHPAGQDAIYLNLGCRCTLVRQR